MYREYVKWYAPSLGRDMELLVYGHSGAPVLMFPTSQGRFYEAEGMGMVNALSDKLDAGTIQLYCVDSVDSESWYNWGASPQWRIGRHMAYDRYLHDEVRPFMGSRNSNGYIISTGCSFGAYQAANFALRHPASVHKLVAMSGRYNMHNYLGGYFDENVYYNSPMDFIGGIQEGEYLWQLRQQQIYLLTGQGDLGTCRTETQQLHDLLNSKGIGNTIEVWEDFTHDWPDWFRQIRKFV